MTLMGKALDGTLLASSFRQGLFEGTREHTEREEYSRTHEIWKTLPGKIDDQLLQYDIATAGIAPLAAWDLVDADCVGVSWFFTI